MKTPRLLVASLVLLTFAVVAYAGPGPTSPLYLTTGNSNILIVQGNSLQSFPEAYAGPNEFPIAVYGDVRTIGQHVGWPGGQYTLGGAPTGTSYAMPPGITSAYDSTSDGAHNYLVEYFSGTVFQTARDFTNAVSIFTTPANFSYPFGITYDATNSSLWISYNYDQRVFDYSMN